MSEPKSRTGRILGRAMRMPAALDRRGTRWMLNALSPAPIVVLVHRGCRSGRIYRTPVEALSEDPAKGEVVVSPMWGEDSDWYRNVIEGGLVEVRRGGIGAAMQWRGLGEAEKRKAVTAYRENHPIYSRIILRMLVRLHRLEGEPVEAVLAALPMLALQRPDGSP